MKWNEIKWIQLIFSLLSSNLLPPPNHHSKIKFNFLFENGKIDLICLVEGLAAKDSSNQPAHSTINSINQQRERQKVVFSLDWLRIDVGGAWLNAEWRGEQLSFPLGWLWVGAQPQGN